MNFTPKEKISRLRIPSRRKLLSLVMLSLVSTVSIALLWPYRGGNGAAKAPQGQTHSRSTPGSALQLDRLSPAIAPIKATGETVADGSRKPIEEFRPNSVSNQSAPWTFKGQVLSPEGRPIEGAHLSLERSPVWAADIENTTTDAQGRFTLNASATITPNSISIVIDFGPSHRVLRSDLRWHVGSIYDFGEIRLSSSRLLQFQLLYDNGLPIAGTTVHCFEPGWGRAVRSTTVKTDKDGVGAYQAQSSIVQLNSFGAVAFAESVTVADELVVIHVGAADFLTVRAIEAGSGQPIAGMQVELMLTASYFGGGVHQTLNEAHPYALARWLTGSEGECRIGLPTHLAGGVNVYVRNQHGACIGSSYAQDRVPRVNVECITAWDTPGTFTFNGNGDDVAIAKNAVWTSKDFPGLIGRSTSDKTIAVPPGFFFSEPTTLIGDGQAVVLLGGGDNGEILSITSDLEDLRLGFRDTLGRPIPDLSVQAFDGNSSSCGSGRTNSDGQVLLGISVEPNLTIYYYFEGQANSSTYDWKKADHHEITWVDAPVHRSTLSFRRNGELVRPGGVLVSGAGAGDIDGSFQIFSTFLPAEGQLLDISAPSFADKQYQWHPSESTIVVDLEMACEIEFTKLAHHSVDANYVLQFAVGGEWVPSSYVSVERREPLSGLSSLKFSAVPPGTYRITLEESLELSTIVTVEDGARSAIADWMPEALGELEINLTALADSEMVEIALTSGTTASVAHHLRGGESHRLAVIRSSRVILDVLLEGTVVASGDVARYLDIGSVHLNRDLSIVAN